MPITKVHAGDPDKSPLDRLKDTVREKDKQKKKKKKKKDGTEESLSNPPTPITGSY